MVKKKEKDGTIIYEADSELRDTENVPLTEEIDDYFAREVLPHIADAWIDYLDFQKFTVNRLDFVREEALKL